MNDRVGLLMPFTVQLGSLVLRFYGLDFKFVYDGVRVHSLVGVVGAPRAREIGYAGVVQGFYALDG
jgi:hypothetical protein